MSKANWGNRTMWTGRMRSRTGKRCGGPAVALAQTPRDSPKQPAAGQGDQAEEGRLRGRYCSIRRIRHLAMLAYVRSGDTRCATTQFPHAEHAQRRPER